MPDHDFATTRLFLDGPLAEGLRVDLGKDQRNYVGNVLRLRAGAGLLVFNGRDGEHRATVETSGKAMALVVGPRTRPQTPAASLRWLFAPLKHARLDYMVQKAVELGAGSIEPVITRHTQVSRINLERMRANVIEAAEQCGVLSVPTVHEAVPLRRVIDGWDKATRLVCCDERAPVADPIVALAQAGSGPFAVLIGPEGGFDESERAMLLAVPGVVRLALGPRILRADTAAVAALALVQAARGDWRGA